MPLPDLFTQGARHLCTGDNSSTSSDLVPDALNRLEVNVELRHLVIGHDVRISYGSEVAAAVRRFWTG